MRFGSGGPTLRDSSLARIGGQAVGRLRQDQAGSEQEVAGNFFAGRGETAGEWHRLPG